MYGKVDVQEEDVGILSMSICQPCYTLVKTITEKIGTFYKICQEKEKDNGTDLKRSVAD